MHFQGYELQILINNIVLKEYLGPRKNVPYRYTSPNWVDNCQTGIRMESEFLHYVLIPSSSTPFTVQVSSSEASRLKPVIAEIRINGVPTQEMSTTYYPSSLNPKGLNLANPEKRQQICVLSKIESQEEKLIGAISVYFYKHETLWQKKSEIPLAVLHLHYRSKDTLFQNIILEEYVDDLNYNENENEKVKVEENINNSLYQIIKQEGGNNITYDDAFGEPLFQDNEMTEQMRYNDFTNFQRNFQPEIIEILDD